MKETSIYILVVHAAILAIQFVLAKMFPTQKQAVFGTYFILLPIGFMCFTPLPPAAVVPLVLGGLIYVFYFADRTAVSSSRRRLEEGREV